VVLLGFAALVVEIIRHRVEPLYRASVFIRAAFTLWFVYLGFRFGEPLLFALAGVVGFGVLLTSTCWWLDRRAARG
jgi:hypothetical protein